MQIKIINLEPAKPKEKPFPKLMLSKDETLVLMISSGEGFYLGKVDKLGEVMYLSETWNMRVFTDFTGTVELSNDP